MSRLADMAQPAAELLFGGGGGVKISEHRILVEAPVGALLIIFAWYKGRIAVNASLKSSIGGDFYTRELKSYFEGESQHTLKRTFAPERVRQQPEQIAREIERHIIEPATPLAFKALQGVADQHNKKREVAEFVNRISKGSAQKGAHGNFTLRREIKIFDPQAYGRIEVRELANDCDVQITGLSLHKLETLVNFLTSSGD
ncbi:hypothetical protein PsAD2_01454 [Pseudovibrio axinellae]|uniref:Uncharacterized protein n=1 Tax=Pseudovibrio axinellae TaxID=989403 RepID=A0A165ZYT9_9HYPH|nr:hypothetical protein [Pseudovibrio axinellae]KZL20411.1 hypothetical protein PsAD2_01454 [Pseudovibrio axinellae]SER77809.1 hypothetical protein SAMN05421798_12227 [Pseudovibrio axinellae]